MKEDEKKRWEIVVIRENRFVLKLGCELWNKQLNWMNGDRNRFVHWWKGVKQKKKMIFTVGSSDKYLSTISRMWSSRKTPKDWTKFWSSCVRHVQMEIMLPLPTRLARTSISVREKTWKSLVHFEGFSQATNAFKNVHWTENVKS